MNEMTLTDTPRRLGSMSEREFLRVLCDGDDAGFEVWRLGERLDVLKAQHREREQYIKDQMSKDQKAKCLFCLRYVRAVNPGTVTPWLVRHRVGKSADLRGGQHPKAWCEGSLCACKLESIR